MSNRIKIGTRGSKLALIQANWVQAVLSKQNPGIEFEIEIFKTIGDKIANAPFAAVGSMGVFTRELEAGLLDRRIDIAVHSLKDMQTDIPDGLKIGAIPERVGARDVLISRDSIKFTDLPDRAIIGTSSARRKGLVASEGRNFDIRECRGNLPRRLEKLEEGQFDAILLAEAGLVRMGLTHRISDYFDVTHFVPAVGQGALGIEIRESDNLAGEFIQPLNHKASFNACSEERIFLTGIGGGCHAPVGGHVYYSDERAHIAAFIGTTDGSWNIRKKITVPEDEVKGLGLKMINEIKACDGIEAFYREVENG